MILLAAVLPAGALAPGSWKVADMNQASHVTGNLYRDFNTSGPADRRN